MKFLVYTESPCISTGAGNVSRHILQFMTEMGYELEVVAVNHHNIEQDKALYPYQIHDSPPDVYLQRRKAKELIWERKLPALFLYADVSPLNNLAEAVREAKQRKNIPVTVYSCLDSDEFNFETASVFCMADHIAVYSEHSKRIVQKYIPALNVQAIYCGCEPDVFFPLSIEQRRQVRKDTFGVTDDQTFIMLIVARNQWRKDIGRALMIAHTFHKLHTNSLLVVHSKILDLGGHLPTMAKIIGMRCEEPGREITFPPPNFDERFGVPREALNSIYNAADCLISTTTGEGWGLTTTEAMTAQCPVIVPRNSSCVEIVGANEERGYLADSGGDVDHMFIPYGNSSNPRPLVHARSMLEKLERVYANRDEAKEKASQAWEWTHNHTWWHAGEQWKALFAKIAEGGAI